MIIFVYGSLIIPELRYRLLDRFPHSTRDRLLGYKLTVHDILPYPNIIESKEDHVDGMTLDVTEEEIKILDKYETDYYKKIEVQLESGTNALVYVQSN